MLILSRIPGWHWRPRYGKRREGPFAYRWLTVGHWQLALVNARLQQELQRQIRAQLYQ